MYSIITFYLLTELRIRCGVLLIVKVNIMVQSFKKSVSSRPVKANAAKFRKRENKAKQAKLGSTLKLPKNKWLDEALDARALSKEIAKAVEIKVAAKVLQGGGKIGIRELSSKAKDMNRDARRNQLKKRTTRVEEKLKILQENQAIIDDL